MNKIAVVTGTRAEYGILKSLIKEIHEDANLELKLLVTGMHLSYEFGLTYKEIEKDGYPIEEKIEMLLSSDTRVAVSKSTALGMIGFAEAFERIQPELVILLGDRFETFAAASAAMIVGIPIAHIHGGELTEGAIDDAIRHSITKMSYLHFTSTEEYRNRVIQLGEDPKRVYNVGALGVENIKRLKLLTKDELEKEISFQINNPTAIVTFHPVTLEQYSAKEQFRTLLEVFDEKKNLNLIFTKANADSEGREINKMIDEYVKKNSERAIGFTSMGQLRYLSTLQYASFVIGNSSSGIIEAPSFNIPTINIGDRQKGRIFSKTVIQCACQKEKISEAIEIALSECFRKSILEYPNPYEKGNVAKEILKSIKLFINNKPEHLKKEFFDLN